MKILPIVNYQTKNQSNKKQDINFGLIKVERAKYFKRFDPVTLLDENCDLLNIHSLETVFDTKPEVLTNVKGYYFASFDEAQDLFEHPENLPLKLKEAGSLTIFQILKEVSSMKKVADLISKNSEDETLETQLVKLQQNLASRIKRGKRKNVQNN